MYLGCLVLYLTIVMAKNLCMGIPISVYETPWMVTIHQPKYINGYDSSDFLCVGVLIKPNAVLASAKCFDTISKNSQIVIFAGNFDNRILHGIYPPVQGLYPFNIQLLENNKIISIFTGKSIEWSSYVDVIAQCTEYNCMFDEIGFQYGFNNQREMKQYNFSNSSALCLEINEDPQLKYCTHHMCSGEAYQCKGDYLTKVHNGQSFLMGFWDYDACEKNIRVFDKLLPDRDERIPRRKLF